MIRVGRPSTPLPKKKPRQISCGTSPVWWLFQSVEGELPPVPRSAPAPKAALAKALEIAEELGLSTCNADSYIGGWG